MSETEPTRLEGVRACVFDAYGTLFDFASAAARALDEPEAQKAALTALWREKQLQYTWLRSLEGRYADFHQVTLDALVFALESLGLDAPGRRERLMAVYFSLDPFPDVPKALREVRRRGFRTAILSNGTRGMLDTLAVHARLFEDFDAILSAELGRRVQDASPGLPARARFARPAGRGHRLPVGERLGRLRGLGLRDARRLVQPLRAEARAAAGRARFRDPDARRIAAAPACAGRRTPLTAGRGLAPMEEPRAAPHGAPCGRGDMTSGRKREAE